MKECATSYIIVPDDDTKKIVPVDSYFKKAVEKGRELFGDDFIIRVFKKGRLNLWNETGDVYNSQGNQIMKKGIKL